jgi:hypothetical protein
MTNEKHWSETAARRAALVQQANALMMRRREIADWRERVENAFAPRSGGL